MGARFKALSARLIDAWVETAPGDMEPDSLCAAVADDLRPTMILGVVETSAPDPRDYYIRFVQRYTLLTRLFCAVSMQQDQRLGDFADQEYMEKSVMPAYRRAIGNGHPVIDLVTTSIVGINAVYDRIILPQKGRRGVADWCIVLSETRLLFSPPQDVPARDSMDDTIVQLLLEGMTAKEIAQRAGVSPRTVEHRIDRLKARYGARNLAHLVALTMSDSLQSAMGADSPTQRA